MSKEEFVKAGSEIEKELYDIFIKNSPIVIADIGSCDGLSSIIYANMFPNAHIHAFEPIVDNASKIVGNFQEYGIMNRATIHLCALSDKNGIAKFYQSYGDAPGMEGQETGNKSSSLLRPRKHITEHNWCKFKESEAETKRLDELHINIDFAHVDVQGAEMLVIKGGMNTFRKMKAIWIEVANIDLYAGQPLKHQISQILTQIGFKCVKDTCLNKKWGDMLWVKK